MDIKQMEFFVVACERGSFSKAAECLYTSQPNISKNIRVLEHELGRPLLMRTGKGVQPTPYGKMVLEHAKQILKNTAAISSLAVPEEKNSLCLSAYPSNMIASSWWIFMRSGRENFALSIMKVRLRKLRIMCTRGSQRSASSMWHRNRYRCSSIFSPIKSWSLWPRM